MNSILCIAAESQKRDSRGLASKFCRCFSFLLLSSSLLCASLFTALSMLPKPNRKWKIAEENPPCSHPSRLIFPCYVCISLCLYPILSLAWLSVFLPAF